MAYNVRIMEKAEEDLSEIVTYISDTLCNRQAADVDPFLYKSIAR